MAKDTNVQASRLRLIQNHSHCAPQSLRVSFPHHHRNTTKPPRRYSRLATDARRIGRQGAPCAAAEDGPARTAPRRTDAASARRRFRRGDRGRITRPRRRNFRRSLAAMAQPRTRAQDDQAAQGAAKDRSSRVRCEFAWHCTGGAHRAHLAGDRHQCRLGQHAASARADRMCARPPVIAHLTR